MDRNTLAPPGASPSSGKASRKLLPALLAGLQGGMLGALWMLLWMGVSSRWEHRSFWSPENLFSTVFYGGSVYGRGFARSTIPGLALYLLLYSLLGAAFSAVVRDRLPRGKVLLAAILLGAAWYFASFRLLWKTMIPLAYLLHSEQPTFLGHLIYGTFLGRFPIYLDRFRMPAHAVPSVPAPHEQIEALPTGPVSSGPEPAAEQATPAPTQSSSPPDPA
jgi:hypothetical protein